MSKPVVLTGLRANSEFHLGNYLGAILPMIELQKQHAGQYQVNMFVPDLHSFTTPIDHGKLYQNTLDNLRVFVAAGLDLNQPDTFIYRQSFIPAHSELTWILSCFTGVGELSRMTQFKDKSQQIYKENSEFYNKELQGEHNWDAMKRKQAEVFEIIGPRVSGGLFNYPVLMAADILLYGAEYVPVGEDQRQHLELTRDLAARMNNKFGGLFTVPHEWQKQLEFAKRDTGIRIRSLRNPDKKMSKSVEDPAGTVMLSDQPEEAAKKIMSATTDSDTEIRIDWAQKPGISNLLQIEALLRNRSLPEVEGEWKGKGNYGELKKAVADTVRAFLADFQAELAAVDKGALLSKLEQDETAMNKVANDTLHRVQVAVGLRSQ